MPPRMVVKALIGVESGNYYKNSEGGRSGSICDAVARTLQIASKAKVDLKVFDFCEVCHKFALERKGSGCKSCNNCGHTTC